MTPEQQAQTIHNIIESAVRWISDDDKNPETPPQEWQEVIPLMKAAPALLDACWQIVNWKDAHSVDGGLPEAVSIIEAAVMIANLDEAIKAARAAIKGSHPDSAAGGES